MLMLGYALWAFSMPLAMSILVILGARTSFVAPCLMPGAVPRDFEADANAVRP